MIYNCSTSQWNHRIFTAKTLTPGLWRFQLQGNDQPRQGHREPKSKGLQDSHKRLYTTVIPIRLAQCPRKTPLHDPEYLQHPRNTLYNCVRQPQSWRSGTHRHTALLQFQNASRNQWQMTAHQRWKSCSMPFPAASHLHSRKEKTCWLKP
jgi:hypothetical protein